MFQMITTPIRLSRSAFALAGVAALALTAIVSAQNPPGGHTAPPEQAQVKPINNLPNPYETVRDWAVLPNGRKWGSVSAIDVDVGGKSILAAGRCGGHTCGG